jgi:alkylation response protein AidB-like acyl-CoA dehydrogenase
MKLQFSAADEAFRLEVRAFVKEHLPADIRRKVELGLRLEHADYVTWFRILEARGWLTPGWPVEHGGPGWNHVQRYIFDEETLLGGAPRIIASGIQMLGPVLHAFGTSRNRAPAPTWPPCAPPPCWSPTASTSWSTATRSGPRTPSGVR